MHASVVTFQVQPGTEDETIRLYREVVISTLKQQKKYKSGYLLIDRNTGKELSISFWESEADARAFESSGLFQLAGKPARELYEVSVQV